MFQNRRMQRQNRVYLNILKKANAAPERNLPACLRTGECSTRTEFTSMSKTRQIQHQNEVYLNVKNRRMQHQNGVYLNVKNRRMQCQNGVYLNVAEQANAAPEWGLDHSGKTY